MGSAMIGGILKKGVFEVTDVKPANSYKTKDK